MICTIHQDAGYVFRRYVAIFECCKQIRRVHAYKTYEEASKELVNTTIECADCHSTLPGPQEFG